MTAKDSKSTPKKAEDAALLERLDTRIRELQEYRGIYTQAVQQTELVYQDQGLLEDQLDDQARDYIALLSEVRAQLAAQAEALAAYRGALTKWADLGTNYRHAITDEMLGQLFSLTDTTTQAHGCEVCALMTADDGTICCWTCGRVIPDSLLGAQS